MPLFGRSKSQSSIEDIAASIQSYISASTWEKSKRVVEIHKDVMLTDQADRILSDQIGLYSNNPFTQEALQEHRDLLRSCRNDGIDTAFRRKISLSGNNKRSNDQDLATLVVPFVQASDLSEARRILDANPALLDPVVDSYINSLIRSAQSDNRSQQLVQRMIERRDLLRRHRS